MYVYLTMDDHHDRNALLLEIEGELTGKVRYEKKGRRQSREGSMEKLYLVQPPDGTQFASSTDDDDDVNATLHGRRGCDGHGDVHRGLGPCMFRAGRETFATLVQRVVVSSRL